MKNEMTHFKDFCGQEPLPAMKGEQMEQARAAMHHEVAQLLALSVDDQLRWTGHKVDLIEIAHDVFLRGHFLDERGRPATFRWIVERLFGVLHVEVPRNPWSLVSKVRRRKNIHQAPYLERYRWALFVADVPRPLAMEVAPLLSPPKGEGKNSHESMNKQK